MSKEFKGALTGALVLGAAGFAIGWAGRSPGRPSWDLFIWLFTVVGANIGLLAGGLTGAFLARRSRKHVQGR
jgi:hypothetical protein